MSRRKYSPMNFSSADDRALIEFIKQNDILWNIGNRDYKNSSKTDDLWQEIANELKKSVPGVKKRWRNLRDYRKSIKKKSITKESQLQENTDSDNEIRFPTDGLNFLETSSNELSAHTEGDVQGSTVQEIFKAQDIFEVDNCETMQSNNLQTSKLDIDDSMTTLELQDSPSMNSSSNGTMMPGTSFTNYTTLQRQDENDDDDDVAYEFKDEPSILLSEIFRDILTQSSKEVHPIKKLFDCFADCVIALPDDLQRDCKNRIMLMISEYEETASYRKIQLD